MLDEISHTVQIRAHGMRRVVAELQVFPHALAEWGHGLAPRGHTSTPSRQKGEHGGVTRVSHHPQRSHCGADSGPRRDAGQEGGDGQTGGPYYPNAVSGFVQGIITAVFTLRTMAERRHSLSRGELRTIPHKAKRLERTPQASTYIVLHDIMATLPPNTAHNPADENSSIPLISRMENTGFEPVTSALQGRR